MIDTRGRNIFDEFRVAILGHGYLSINKQIKKIYRTLINDYQMELDELISECFIRYQKEKWKLSYDDTKGSWATFITMRVKYALLDILDKQKFIYNSPEFNDASSKNTDLTKSAIDNYTDGITPEDEFVEQETLARLNRELGVEVVKGILSGDSLKKVSEDIGYNYEALRKKYQRLKKKFDR